MGENKYSNDCRARQLSQLWKHSTDSVSHTGTWKQRRSEESSLYSEALFSITEGLSVDLSRTHDRSRAIRSRSGEPVPDSPGTIPHPRDPWTPSQSAGVAVPEHPRDPVTPRSVRRCSGARAPA